MLVEHHTASERPDSHESRFHKEEFPFFWVVNVYAKYTRQVEVELKKIDIDLSRFRVLMLVHQYHRASISRITEYAVSKMPTVTKIVGRLRDDGLLTTHVSASDGRGRSSHVESSTSLTHRAFSGAIATDSGSPAETDDPAPRFS
jgi:sugar diacid utilization regulator